MVPWQPEGPFTFSGSTAEPCWDKPFVDTLQKHHGCSRSKQCSLGKQPSGRSLHILSCNCLPALDENKNPTQTAYNSLIISAGQLGAITSPSKHCAICCLSGKAAFLQEATGKELVVIFILPDLYLPLLSSTPSSPFRPARATKPLLHVCWHGYKTCLQHTSSLLSPYSKLLHFHIQGPQIRWAVCQHKHSL